MAVEIPAGERIFLTARCAMGTTIQDLLQDIKNAETLEEIEPLAAALEAGALILERENEFLRARVKDYESRG
jgi:hypothetical protein